MQFLRWVKPSEFNNRSNWFFAITYGWSFKYLTILGFTWKLYEA